ncbi:hypothetical protein DPMN_044084 [Dreissena polymorpha]|uniref:Uncharacterized protein n=1 Tax=Dreissena polymorpha TaxID=45954 RepID=A0A9D4D1M6_DREPO|nr:hypothetical protein DPMN_044084 [Dreissena polymorpha]
MPKWPLFSVKRNSSHQAMSAQQQKQFQQQFHRLSIPLVQDPQSTDANRRNKTGQSATQPVAAVVTILTPVKTRSSETISNTASCSSCYRMTPVKTRSSETISNTASCSSCYHIDPSQK